MALHIFNKLFYFEFLTHISRKLCLNMMHISKNILILMNISRKHACSSPNVANMFFFSNDISWLNIANNLVIIALSFIASSTNTFDLNFNSEIRRDHRKIFLWSPRLWVGRRCETNLGNISKMDVEWNSRGKGLNNIKWDTVQSCMIYLYYKISVQSWYEE